MANDVKIQDVKTISKVFNRNCFVIIFFTTSMYKFKVLYYLRLRKASTPKKAV